ncbi:YkvA family protein [Bacteroidota bacterium]
MEEGYENKTAFRKTLEDAKELINDRDKLEDLIYDAYVKIGNIKIGNTKLALLFEKVELFVQMIRAYVKGEYRELPMRSIILIAAGLLYFINPLDFIPDIIPITGYLDDLSIIVWIAHSIDKDIKKFEEFLNSKVIQIDPEGS